MTPNQELYEYLQKHTWDLTEEWYAALDKESTSGVYASNDATVIETIKQQNHGFHERFCKVFVQDEATFLKEFEAWVLEIARDPEHLNTPLHFILQEFFNTQQQYIHLLYRYERQASDLTHETVQEWIATVTKTFSKLMTWFTEEHHNYSLKKLRAQQEMINELSTPVISLSNGVALLPLVGDIDTNRAKHIFENALTQCTQKRVQSLLIDISGVAIIDTMVAQQIFQLIEALRLLGVESTLSGIRPEIAQTAVQLGISFQDVNTISTIERAVQRLFTEK
ncbi:RsbT co-antagonist protein RsbRB [Chryseomicrobium excrementi]|uniref:RsbT co-antagonist protein RsbRB n=1 Tax=Chryseomicrobium excrementi TaxID=2041346 RepID=A0A2M9EZ47_9BACL|nr:STAS domain-containing protein [Chryseomicrobium excrementi]PJK16466.1 RsbT co-antagonist protein RsbRB [Chryseomicrobium excrementi]